VELKGLDILLTYECTGRCPHCCYRAGPGENQTMSLAELETCLTAVADQPLEGILLFGGEPFVCYDLLKAGVAMAAQLSYVYVFTNGSWATDLDTARELLAGLQQEGLDYIMFSVDAFHQTRVPIERVATGLRAARELGYGAVEIDNRCLGEPGTDNPSNRRTGEIMARLAELCDLGGVKIHQGPARIVGRAADALSQVAPRSAPTSRCPLPDYLGGDLCAPNGIEIHPGGWVNFCAGLALGNMEQRPLGEILAGYDPDAHPIIRVLAEGGPLGLLRLAEEHGYKPDGEFADGCHLCYEVRDFLHPHYPDHLAPARVYERGI